MMEALTEYIIHLGIVAVIAVIFAESGLLVGFFLPGDSLLFMSGFLTQQGIFKINIHLFALLLFIAAVAGDNVGYSFGKRVGRKLFERPNSRLFKQQYLVQAEQFFEKHGSKAIVLARFVPVVRTFTPIIAGVSTMHYRTFFVYNLIGGFLWTATFSYAGYYIGQKLHEMGFNIEIISIVIILISVAPIAIHAVSSQERRQALMAQIKNLLMTIRGIFTKEDSAQ